MRGIFGAGLASLLATVAPVTQAAAQPLSEASGNWAGSNGGGYFFRATLEQVGDAARLRIWHDLGAVPAGGDAQLDVAGFALSAFATDQRLEVVETTAGTILLVITEFADEESEGREVVQVVYMDNQFTVIDFWHQSAPAYDGAGFGPLDCHLNLWNGKVTVNGTQSDLPPLDFEALNASGWSYATPFDRGWCPGG